MSDMRIENLKDAKRIVVKVGTSTLTHATGLLNLKSLENIVRQLVDLHNSGLDIVLVTSGAIGAGVGRLGTKGKPLTIPEKQATAAIGQGVIMHMYEKLFSEYGKTVAQILLTREDMSYKTRYQNARNTIFTLFELGAIPIVNENDAIAVEEIKFGDNDTLSAEVSKLIKAQLLIVLSDINGLYDSNPHINPKAKLIEYVTEITEEIENSAEDSSSKLGTGGMITKLKAAKIAVSAGCHMVIADGKMPDVLSCVYKGKNIGTFFEANMSSRIEKSLNTQNLEGDF